MNANKNDGIQLLLQAEKKAAEKVNEARRRKARRLKQAKQEAEVEINAERAERERQFKMKESEMLGSKGDIEQQINESLGRALGDMQQSVVRNKDRAVHLLLSHVVDIKPELHGNYRATI